MSKVEKLQILGVRSFDNRHPMTIQFYAPLTLIVGQNGSGKTTIIECLKYITTGEMPPNTRIGGGWIHDPKLCNEKEVLAQIKVQFRSTEGVRMVCTRSLQLTVKKNARTMKTLDGSLMMVRDGEKTTLSSRTAEMDSMMPRFLGVSKAVLESVIFCHQEDSLWPLSEPKKLKERFDEIFEALKYTRAIDNIKVLQKNKRTELVRLKADEDHAKVDNERAKRCKTEMLKLDAESEDLRTRHEELGVKHRDAAKRTEEAWKKTGEAELIVGRLTGKRIEQATKEESVQALRENLEERSDSDAELQKTLEEYETRVEQYESELDQQKADYKDYGVQLQEIRERLSTKERECGLYEARKQTHERQVEDRAILIKETARSHGIRGYDLDLDDEQIRNFMDRIVRLARDQNNTFERARSEAQERMQDAQRILNQINERKSLHNQRKESARQVINGNDRKISNLQSELDRINVDEGRKAGLDSQLKETQSRLKTAKEELASSNWDAEILAVTTKLREQEEANEKLVLEQSEGIRRARESAEIDHVRKEHKDRQTRLKTMIDAYAEKIDIVLGQGWRPQTLESDFDRVVKDKEAQVSETTRQRDGTSREQEQVDFKLNICRSDLKSGQASMKAAEKSIKDTVDCEPSEYHEELEKLEMSRDYIKNDSESAKRLIEYFDACIKAAHQHKACKTCMRPLKDKDLDRLVRLVEDEKRKLQSPGDEIELQTAEEELKQARAVGQDFDTWERLKEKELPILQVQEKRLSEQRQELSSRLEEQDSIVREREAELRDVVDLGRTVRTIAKYSLDIASFEVQIEELSAKQRATGTFRGIEAIQNEMKEVTEEKKKLQARQTELTNARERGRATLNTLELESRDVQSKLSTAEYQLKEKRSIEGQVDEYKTLNSEQREIIKRIDLELQNLGPELSTAQVKYDDTVRLGQEKDRELQAQTSKLNNSVSQLKTTEQQIKEYIDQGGPSQLESSKRDVESMKAEVRRVTESQTQCATTAKRLEDQLRNHSETKRSITDNQRYRRDLRQLQAVSAEIAELEKHNAEADKARYENEVANWQKERNKIAAQQSTVVGQLTELDRQIQQLQKDWESDYKHAAGKYRAAHVHVETTKAAIEDLGRYGGALDKAIMKYHSLKMEEVNRIVEELWRNTYQGTDVDTILIRSDIETVKANKSYNYRVCMIKQDAEMDMRGRCSAGQKVLASIIIRLALAECFGVNCGVIALDEPTTNLDKQNIQALAQSLNKIIKVRQAQRNFQLIVITHDEEFLKEMGCDDFADSYFRVSRDEQQKSVIEKQNLSDVM